MQVGLQVKDAVTLHWNHQQEDALTTLGLKEQRQGMCYQSPVR